jgi:hypothetical protein
MDKTANDLDQTEEQMLFDDVSDEALEAAAAAMGSAIPTASIDIIPPNCC